MADDKNKKMPQRQQQQEKPGDQARVNRIDDDEDAITQRNPRQGFDPDVDDIRGTPEADKPVKR